MSPVKNQNAALKQKTGIRITLWRALRDWWDEWPRWAILCAMWTLCWFTVILGPPATFALAYATYGTVREGQSYSLADLLAEARRRFAVSWLWAFINIVVALFSWMNLNFYPSLGAPFGPALTVLTGFLVFFWWAGQLYGLAYYYQMEPPGLLRALRNGIYVALAAPGYTIVVGGLALLTGVVSVVLVAPLLLGIPALLSLVGARAVDDRLVAFGIRPPEDLPLEE